MNAPDNFYNDFWSLIAEHSNHSLSLAEWQRHFSGFLEDEAIRQFLHPGISGAENVLHRFNFQELHLRAAEALPVAANVWIGNAPLTWMLGGLHFGTVRRKRVYLSYMPPDDMLMGASCILAADRNPCFLLSPHCQRIDDFVRTTLNALDITLLPVQEILTVDRFGKVSPRLPLHPALDAYAREETEDSLERRTFPVPVGIEWKDIHFHFLDQHTVTCRVGGSHATFNYKEMGMGNVHTGKPDSIWALFMSLAAKNGLWQCDWRNYRQSKSAQQKKCRLCRVLKCFFNKTDNPIRWSDDRRGYVWDFTILPESHSTNYHRRLRKK